jgi:hypothetical protein
LEDQPSKRRRSLEDDGVSEPSLEGRQGGAPGYAAPQQEDANAQEVRRSMPDSDESLPITGMPSFSHISEKLKDTTSPLEKPGRPEEMKLGARTDPLQSAMTDESKMFEPTVPLEKRSLNLKDQISLSTDVIGDGLCTVSSAVGLGLSITSSLRTLGSNPKVAIIAGSVGAAGILVGSNTGKEIIASGLTTIIERSGSTFENQVQRSSIEPLEDFIGELSVNQSRISLMGETSSSLPVERIASKVSEAQSGGAPEPSSSLPVESKSSPKIPEARSCGASESNIELEKESDETMDCFESSIFIASALENQNPEVDWPFLLIKFGVQLTIYLILSIFIQDYKKILRNGAIFIREKYSISIGNFLLFALDFPFINHGFAVRFFLCCSIIFIFCALLKYI